MELENKLAGVKNDNDDAIPDVDVDEIASDY